MKFLNKKYLKISLKNIILMKFIYIINLNALTCSVPVHYDPVSVFYLKALCIYTEALAREFLNRFRCFKRSWRIFIIAECGDI